MQRYRTFQPTGFDPKGLGLDDKQDWLVAPVSQHRDSGCLDQSNFAVALDSLGGESETVEVHRFGHWANGWFEIILVSPQMAQEVEDIEASLENYPVLSDEHYSRLQWETAHEYWEHISLKERIYWCDRYHVSVFAARRDTIPDDLKGELLSALAE